MLNKIKITLIALASLIAITPAVALADTKGSVICGVNVAGGNVNGQNCNTTPQKTDSLDGTISNILNILSSVVGAAATFMVIFSGLRYIISGGEAEKVKSAKRTLLFAIIGLALVALTQIIVHTVLSGANAAANSDSVLFYRLP